MAETPEIPEADDSFGKRVAITIAVLAACMSVIGNKGDNAKTESILQTTEKADQFAYYQAKSIKQNSYELARDHLLLMHAEDGVKRDELLKAYTASIVKYEGDKEAALSDAKAAEKAATIASKINDRTDLATLALQFGIILCSVAILVKLHHFWIAGIIAGLVGAVVGATAWFM